MLFSTVLATLSFAASGLAQDLPHIQTEGLVQNGSRWDTRLRVDNGTYGPIIEEVHYCKLQHRARPRT